jgi:hypothetical protein
MDWAIAFDCTRELSQVSLIWSFRACTLLFSFTGVFGTNTIAQTDIFPHHELLTGRQNFGEITSGISAIKSSYGNLDGGF